MVKIADDSEGRILKNGVIEKTITPTDLRKLNKGADLAKNILITAGAEPGSIVTTKIRGAHPGGGAAIGEIVNAGLQTKIGGLFVCDSSVLPKAPGLPPILTITALAKKFVRKLLPSIN